MCGNCTEFGGNSVLIKTASGVDIQKSSKRSVPVHLWVIMGFHANATVKSRGIPGSIAVVTPLAAPYAVAIRNRRDGSVGLTSSVD